jgi:ribosome maturation factor RimP
VAVAGRGPGVRAATPVGAARIAPDFGYGVPTDNSTAGRMPVSTDQTTRDRLAEVLTEPLAAAGLDVEAIELTPAGKRRLLRVAVDKDGGVTMDDISDATKEVSRLLDETDAMAEHPYTLEVTSPGTDRPLTLPRHWRRNEDRLVKVTATDGDTFTGRIIGSDEERATLDIEGQKREIALADVAKARIQIEFNRKES